MASVCLLSIMTLCHSNYVVLDHSVSMLSGNKLRKLNHVTDYSVQRFYNMQSHMTSRYSTDDMLYALVHVWVLRALCI